MTTINILLYTDTKEISVDQGRGPKRVSILKNLLETKKLAFAEFKLTVINRYDGFTDTTQPPTHQKITPELLENFDELWLFGWYQKDVRGPFTELYGGPDNELDEHELGALESWMTKGGLLISGDHSSYAPGGNENDPIETYLCLGRALGYQVPRARDMRSWEGRPTAKFESSFNTLVRTEVSSEGDSSLEEDVLPQRLVFPDLDAQGQPHRVFLGKEKIITILPDHPHEGEARVPQKPDDKWPPFGEKDPDKKHKPTVIANGCDKRTCESTAMLVVYDGDKWGIGRIAADSSWHHYMDINLKGWKDGNHVKVLDLMAQFYQNLALYLAPLAKRQEMSGALIDWVLHHPEVQEERGNHPLIVGKVALSYLSKVATGCEIYELVQVALSAETGVAAENFNFPTLASGIAAIPSQELIVGSIVNYYYRAASEQLNQKASVDTVGLEFASVIATGLKEAFRTHEQMISQFRETTSRNLELISETEQES